ncbi:MAG TPA: PIG-L deacetylase family protein [Longimicrobiales bacterium]
MSSALPTDRKTLLLVLSHPDDEIGFAGTIAAHVAGGHRVVLTFLTRGEMTESLGVRSAPEVAALREQHAFEAGRMLGCEIRFLNYPDTRVQCTPDANYDVARLLAEVKPNALLTWGSAWIRGMRHPDHQATGEIARNAITLARIARVVAPLEPHRDAAPVYTLRDRNSLLPRVAINVSDQLDKVLELGRFYRERVGWPREEWLRNRLLEAGRGWGVPAAEVFDAWETAPGLYASLFDAVLLPPL